MNTANKITFLRIVMVPIFMFFAAPIPSFYPNALTSFLQEYGMIIAIIIFILASITDSIDGYLARRMNQITELGKFLDPVADKLLVIAALVILVGRQDLSIWIAMIIIAREIIIMAIRTIAAKAGVVIAASFWAKIKTILQIVAIVAIMLNTVTTMYFLPDVLMGIAVIATIFSGYEYIKKNGHVVYKK